MFLVDQILKRIGEATVGYVEVCAEHVVELLEELVNICIFLRSIFGFKSISLLLS